MIEKSFLHLDQREFMGMRKDKKKGETKERKKERKSSFLLFFQRSNSESLTVKKRAGLCARR